MLGSGNAIGQTVLQAARHGGRAFDGFAAPYALFGAAELLTAYTGAFGRWRRSSDNDQQDLWIRGTSVFLGGGEALASWLGSDSAFWTTLYDQSGNGRHAVNATAAPQPRAALAGVVDVGAAGRPLMMFDGANDVLVVGASTGFAQAADAVTLAMIGQPSNEAATPCAIGCATAATTQRASMYCTTGASSIAARRQAADASSGVGQATPAGMRRRIARARFADGFVDMAVDGATASAAMNGTPGPSENIASSAGVSIGRPGSLGSNWFAGPISFVLLSRAAEDIAALDAAMARLMP